MKGINLMCCLMLLFAGLRAQDTLNHNGYNLEPYCEGEACLYVIGGFPIHYPNLSHVEWVMENFEMALKKSNGQLIMTADLHVAGVDSAAVIELEFLFVNGDDETIFRFKSGKFEFFNDHNYAEPIVFSTRLPPSVAEQVSTVDVEIRHTDIIPYFQVQSNCFLPCKELRLKEAIKKFKKAK